MNSDGVEIYIMRKELHDQTVAHSFLYLIRIIL